MYFLKLFLKNLTPEFLDRKVKLERDEFLKIKEFKNIVKEYRKEEKNVRLKMGALYYQWKKSRK